VNGQTGKVTGEAPLSYFKIALVAGAVLIAILLVVVLAALMSK